MKVYIAGKITGNGRYREEFAAAERKVRAMGHIALNPAALPEGMEPADYMRICMAMLDSADAIAIMRNWTESTGARIEFAYAQYVHKKVLKLWLMPESPAKKIWEPEMDVSPERLEQAPRWISVEERLPEMWQNEESGELINYMIHSPYFGVDIGNYNKDAETWLCRALPCTVTHWMPLPEPPEVE